MDGVFNIYYLFIFFIIYSFLGWVLEVIYHVFTDKKFINRGFLYGPVCPIYGSGAVLMILFLTPLNHNTFYLFIGGFIFATVLEYVTGYVLERVFNAKWWDYSEEKFNLKGYVSLKFSLIWGLVAVFMMRVLQPEIAQLVSSIPTFILEPLYNIILIVFVVDLTLTFNSLVEFRKILKDLNNIKVEINNKMKSRDGTLKEYKQNISIRLKGHHVDLFEAYPKLGTNKINKLINEIRNKVDEG